MDLNAEQLLPVQKKSTVRIPWVPVSREPVHLLPSQSVGTESPLSAVHPTSGLSTLMLMCVGRHTLGQQSTRTMPLEQLLCVVLALDPVALQPQVPTMLMSAVTIAPKDVSQSVKHEPPVGVTEKHPPPAPVRLTVMFVKNALQLVDPGGQDVVTLSVPHPNDVLPDHTPVPGLYVTVTLALLTHAQPPPFS